MAPKLRSFDEVAANEVKKPQAAVENAVDIISGKKPVMKAAEMGMLQSTGAGAVHAAEQTSSRWSRFKETAKEVGQAIGSAASKAAHKVGGAVKGAAHSVSEKISPSARTVDAGGLAVTAKEQRELDRKARAIERGARAEISDEKKSFEAEREGKSTGAANVGKGTGAIILGAILLPFTFGLSAILIAGGGLGVAKGLKEAKDTAKDHHDHKQALADIKANKKDALEELKDMIRDRRVSVTPDKELYQRGHDGNGGGILAMSQAMRKAGNIDQQKPRVSDVGGKTADGADHVVRAGAVGDSKAALDAALADKKPGAKKEQAAGRKEHVSDATKQFDALIKGKDFKEFSSALDTFKKSGAKEKKSDAAISVPAASAMSKEMAVANKGKAANSSKEV